MRISQVIYSLDYGGAEKFCINLSNELSKGNDVSLISLKDHQSQMISTKTLSPRVKFFSAGLKTRLNMRNWVRVYKILKAINPDIIHTHLSSIIYVAPYAFIHRKKVVHTVHSLADKDATKPTRWILNRLFKTRLFYPVSISKEVLRSVHEIYSSRHHYLIENGIPVPFFSTNLKKVQLEVERYKITPSTKIILNIASVKRIKNQSFLVSAIKKLAWEGHDIMLICIGDTTHDNQEYYNSFSETLTERSRFLGIKENVADYLSCANVFCLASEYEGLPMTLLEAISIGTIPLCTAVGGIKNVLDESKGIGYLYEFNDIDMFRAKLLTILQKDDMRVNEDRLRLKALFENEYTISICAARYLTLFNNLLHA